MIFDGYNRFVNPTPEAVDALNRMVALGKPMEPIVTDEDRKLAAELLSESESSDVSFTWVSKLPLPSKLLNLPRTIDDEN